MQEGVRLDAVWYLAREWAATREFYSTVLGLTASGADGESTWVEFQPGRGVRLALSGQGPDDLHGGAVPVFLVPNLGASLDEIAANGGTVINPTLEGDGSSHAFVYDPTGNGLQLLQQARQPAAASEESAQGDGLVTGMDLVWNSTLYPEWETARTFYSTTLGLAEIAHENGPHWALFDTGSHVRLSLSSSEAGQMGPAGAWVVVLEVRDMDEALARLKAAHAEHHEDPADTPGRLVSFYDPSGNQLQLHWNP